MAKRTGVDEFKLIGLLWRDSPVSPRSGISTQVIRNQRNHAVTGAIRRIT